MLHTLLTNLLLAHNISFLVSPSSLLRCFAACVVFVLSAILSRSLSVCLCLGECVYECVSVCMFNLQCLRVLLLRQFFPQLLLLLLLFFSALLCTCGSIRYSCCFCSFSVFLGLILSWCRAMLCADHVLLHYVSRGKLLYLVCAVLQRVDDVRVCICLSATLRTT